MDNLTAAATSLKQGGIIAYPTEGVYGLGCDPNNLDAVKRLLKLKQRAENKGLILIASEWSQLEPYLQPLTALQKQTILATWPGPVTWVIPAAENISSLVRGKHLSLAVRMTAHPIAAELCKRFGGAITSTSANISGDKACTTDKEVQHFFDNKLDVIVKGKIGSQVGPTAIYDLLSGKKLR